MILQNENKFRDLIDKGALYIKDILDLSIKRNQNESVLIIYDEDYELASILLEAYKLNFVNDKLVTYINFNNLNKEEILSEINNLKEKDLVVMIQSTNFRLDDFRIRLHLFSRKLKVIEHMHLNRNKEEVYDVYIESLKYDKEYYYKYGHGIKSKLASASKLIINSNDVSLVVDGELEEAKLNIGDYDALDNIGGTFPIGEVFSESKKLEDLHGEIYIYALADDDFVIRMYEPFKIFIENGEIVSYGDNAPEHFIKVYNEVKNYERPVIREIGFGLNKAITKERPLGDITAFERIYGMHLSLGEKHTVYKKENITSKKSRYHVDLFPVVDQVTYLEKNSNGTESSKKLILYKDGEYQVD